MFHYLLLLLHMDTSEIENFIVQGGLRLSPVRVLVVRSIHNAGRPLSSLELEEMLQTVDRSSITRTLAGFEEHGLVRKIDDGSGAGRYELCRHENEGSGSMASHPHFYCVRCGHTMCLSNMDTPRIELPADYVATSINYVIKGICPKCR